MIHRLILSSLALGVVTNAMAQNTKHNLLPLSPEQAKNRQIIGNLLRANPHSGQVHKPTGIKQRVVAQAFSIDGDADSTVYAYSGTNGSSFDYNNFFNLSYSTEFAPDMSPAFVPLDRKPSTDVMADEIASYGDGEAYYQSQAYYNTSGKIDSVHAHQIFDEMTPYRRSYVSYTGAGYVGELVTFTSDDDVAYTPYEKRTITHSGSGQVLTDSIFSYSGSTWVMDYAYTYHYNGSGKLDTLTYSEEQLVFTYDTDGRIATVKGYFSMGGEAFLYMADSFGYTTGIDYATYYHEVYYGGDGVLGGIKILQYPGASGTPDSLEMYEFDEDVWVKGVTGKYTYNSFGNPEMLSVEGEISGEAVSGSVAFYYEEYDDGLSIDDTDNNKNFSVYPNPFSSSLNISYAGEGSSNNVGLQLTDITGRVVFNTKINLNQGVNYVALPEIAAGNYVLTLNGASGKAWSSKLVKK